MLGDTPTHWKALYNSDNNGLSMNRYNYIKFMTTLNSFSIKKYNYNIILYLKFLLIPSMHVYA